MAGASKIVIYSLANESYFSEMQFEVEEPFDNYVIKLIEIYLIWNIFNFLFITSLILNLKKMKSSQAK